MIQSLIQTAKSIRNYRLVLYILVASLVMVFFTYLTPPLFNKPFFSFLVSFDGISIDNAIYLSRFMLSFLLLGIVPLITVFLCGQSPRLLGLIIRIKPFRWYHMFIFIIIAVTAGVTGGLDKSISGFYPYTHSLITEVQNVGWSRFIIHTVLYGFFYYLPWELFFRGFLILPFIDKLIQSDKDLITNSDNRYLLYGIIAFQTIPSTLLHFGHPMTELISAIPAGILFGWLVYKTKSIFPAFILHFIVGISTDATIIFSQLGY